MAEDERILMAAENLKQGLELGPIFYVVAAEQADKFSRALGCTNPLFTADAPPGSRLAPPTMRLQDYALLIAAHFKGGSGGVHAKHWTELHEPVRVGQAVRTAGKITRTWHRRGKFYFELEYETCDAVSGQLLTRQAITAILLRGGEMR